MQKVEANKWRYFTKKHQSLWYPREFCLDKENEIYYRKDQEN